jgi:xanthine dehydrogenase/oxidase
MRYPQHYFSTAIPAHVAVYHVDGSVAVSHGGIEMGQGINTKVAQVVAHTLGVPLESVTVKPTNNFVTANAIVTGGAATSELACFAALQACNKLLERMAPIKEKMKGGTWAEITKAAYMEGMDLASHHLPNAADNLKAYNVWGLNLTEVEVDMLTGEYKIVRVDQIQDAGKSLSQEVDIGQIEGCIEFGLGLWTTEKLVYDENTGELLTNNTWEYKVPLPKDIPEDLRVTMLKNAPNPLGVLSSKATGEPPLCMSSCVLFAMRNAIDSARADAGNTDYYPIDPPITPEEIVRLSLSTKDKFVI